MRSHVQQNLNGKDVDNNVINNKFRDLQDKVFDQLENLTFKLIFDKIQPFIGKYNIEKKDLDEKFEDKLNDFNFIDPIHLELDMELKHHVSLPLIIKKFETINQFKTPKDKLISMINICKLVSGMLTVEISSESRCT